MKRVEYDKMCYWTEQREDHVLLRNVVTGQLAFSVSCSRERGTVQVRLPSGEHESWLRVECAAITGTGIFH